MFPCVHLVANYCVSFHHSHEEIQKHWSGVPKDRTKAKNIKKNLNNLQRKPTRNLNWNHQQICLKRANTFFLAISHKCPMNSCQKRCWVPWWSKSRQHRKKRATACFCQFARQFRVWWELLCMATHDKSADVNSSKLDVICHIVEKLVGYMVRDDGVRA